MCKQLYTIFSISVLCLFAVNAQQGIIPPVIKSVSVDTIKNQIVVRWEPSTSPNIISYMIGRYDSIISGFREVDTVPSNILSWRDTVADPSKTYYEYTVWALDNTGSRSNSEAHRSIHLTITYDSCAEKKKLVLNWTKYRGWKVKRYYVKWNTAAVGLRFEDYISRTDTTTFLKDPTAQLFTFYVMAVSDNQLYYANSNVAAFNVTGSIGPGFIENSEIISANDSIEITYLIDKKSTLQRYALLRANDMDFQSADTIDNSFYEQPIYTYHFTDPNTYPAKRQYYYKLLAKNGCNVPVKTSDIGTNIVLKVENDKFTDKLRWLADDSIYKNRFYVIYRTDEDGLTEMLDSFMYKKTYDDFVKDKFQHLIEVKGGNVVGKFCYYIKSTATMNNFDSLTTSISNQACIILTPEIPCPTAIDPISSIEEDRYFRPKLLIQPYDYSLIIYDRLGNEIFVSTDYDKPWNGMLKNGQPAEEGVYYFYIMVKFTENQEIKKAGTVTLIFIK